MLHESWKTVIRDERNMRDAFNYFMDDYEKLLDFYNSYDEDRDDATWIHVDEAREERLALEEKIELLEKALAKRNEEYNDLAYKYKQLQKQSTGKTLPKRKSRLSKPVSTIEDDEIPF